MKAQDFLDILLLIITLGVFTTHEVIPWLSSVSWKCQITS